MALTKVIGDGIGAVTGNVGIGEAAPANLLHVKVSDTGIAPHASAQIVLEREGTNYLQFLTAEAGTSGILFGDGSDIDVAQIKYDHNTTAMSFVTETNTAMVIDGNGAVSFSLTPCFSASAATTNIPLATQTKVTLSSERFDQGSDLNVGTDTFTAPITGKYLFTYILFFDQLDADHTTLDATIVTSNRSYQQTVTPDHFLNSDSRFSLTGTMICDMDASDTLHLNVYVSDGDAQTDIHTDSHVSGALIC